MGKKAEDKEPRNKTHKTLREKLRKKRESLKEHKKEKKLKHQKYDTESKRALFFQQKNKALKVGEIKEKKLVKHIGKFINIYEDDLEDFFEIFETFDKGGEIDISELQSKPLQKCLKKMFKYLPLQRKKMVFNKKKKAQTNLSVYMRNQVSAIIQDYIENGSEDQKSKQPQGASSSQEQQYQKKTKITNTIEGTSEGKTVKQNRSQREEQQQQRVFEKTLNVSVGATEGSAMGPFISAEERTMIAQAFAKQLLEEEKQAQEERQQQDNEFDRIFSMSTQREKKNKKVQLDQKVPQNLLAEGSAQIGEKVQVDEDYLEKYNQEHRPKRLIDQHRQMMQERKEHSTSNNNERKPFDRERDVVNGRYRQGHQMMNNSMFFDFKDRMTKPKGTNNFL